MPSLPTVDSLNVIVFPSFVDPRGTLGVAELDGRIGFAVRRLFWIDRVPQGSARGGHAHRKCNQFMLCLNGSVAVETFDGRASREFKLNKNDGLLIPPAIFATEHFAGDQALLVVLCDQPYDKADYIHDRAGLVAFRNSL